MGQLAAVATVAAALRALAAAILEWRRYRRLERDMEHEQTSRHFRRLVAALDARNREREAARDAASGAGDDGLREAPYRRD